MFCSRCGSEITGKSKFCPSCGLDLMGTTPVHAVATGQLQETDLVREALAAEYEILEELGRGGMALVYRARDRHLEREVAIKVLPFSLAFDSEFVERFQREARTAAQLEHPNIIPIYRVGRSGRVIYFVMKYLRGGALSNILAERSRLSPPEIRRLLLEAGSALGYAAQRGIVHRDIKPDNIMFDEFGQCMLTDFGIAKAASGQKLTGTGMSIGTPHYMSPEQARAQGIDGRSDIYSLGVVAYQSLTGTVPYDGEDSFSIGYKHITEPVPTPALVTADERRLFEVIKRMLMKDPLDRYQSCEELLAALQGQATAAPGGLRASPAAVGVPVGASAALASAAVGAGEVRAFAVPPIVSQPTTPLESPLVNRRLTPRERREQPRRVADRSLAMRGGSKVFGWLWLVLGGLGAIGAAVYYYESHGFAPGQPPLASDDSVVDASGGALVPAPVSGPPRADRLRADRLRVDTTAAHPPSVEGQPAGATRPASTPAADSGGLRLSGLPRGSTVLVDERPVRQALTWLPAGRHALAVSAPRHDFYADTVQIVAGDTLKLTPRLTPIGAATAAADSAAIYRAAADTATDTAADSAADTAPAAVAVDSAAARPARARPTAARAGRCEPGPDYNAGAVCFDERPKPVNPPFVPIPLDAQGTPQPSLLWVKVSAEGRTVDLRRLRPSDDLAFDRDVRSFAWTVAWHPAMKGGAPVEAWTQMIFPPTPRE